MTMTVIKGWASERALRLHYLGATCLWCATGLSWILWLLAHMLNGGNGHKHQHIRKVTAHLLHSDVYLLNLWRCSPNEPLACKHRIFIMKTECWAMWHAKSGNMSVLMLSWPTWFRKRVCCVVVALVELKDWSSNIEGIVTLLVINGFLSSPDSYLGGFGKLVIHLLYADLTDNETTKLWDKRFRNAQFLTSKLLFCTVWMLTKSLTMKASRYVDILSVGSNVVTLTGVPSMLVSVISVQGEEESDLC